MLLLLFGIAAVKTAQDARAYIHIDYISEQSQEECFLCGTINDSIIASYWGEDNVGIINLNTFELLRLEINRYDNYGQLIEKAAGYMQSSGMSDDGSYVHAWTYPDNGYASVQITGTQYSVERESVQSHLCQSCLDQINEMWFGETPPAEYAIVSFAERTIRPLVECYTWFSAGNYGIDCDFNSEGDIDLLIHYCPPRYA